MKHAFAIGTLLILMSTVVLGHLSRRVKAVPIQPFDAWENICWGNEKGRLDNFAIQLQRETEWLGYVVVYAGRESCADEAVTRAVRAKKWLERRGVPSNRILWRNGGFREHTETQLWIWPIGEGVFPVDPKLDRSEVKVVRSCRGRILNPVQCK